MPRALPRLPTLVLALGTSLAALAPAQAGVTAYTDAAAFGAAVGAGLRVEGFETLPADTPIANGDRIGDMRFSFSDLAAPGRVDALYAHFDEQGLASGAFDDGFFMAGDEIRVQFAQPVRAFGVFFAADLSPAGALYVEAVGQGSAGSGAIADPSPFHFVGLTSDQPFTEVRFGAHAGRTGAFTVDNLSFARASVPEPTPLPMVLAALAAAGFVARRRYRR